jgi:rifampicin phosphotransferase
MYTGTFEKPAPGTWMLETVHYVRPVSRFAQIASYTDGFVRGFEDGLRNYGALLERMEIRFVNGFFYQRLVPLGAPPEAKGPPPKLVFKALTLLHPAMRARLKRSAEVMRTKRWRADLNRFEQHDKPALLRDLRALRDVDLKATTDDALLEHLDACVAVLNRSLYQHHLLTPAILVVIGDFMLRVGRWTGASVPELLAVLRGSSRSSVGAKDELCTLARALAADRSASALLASAMPAQQIVEALLAQSGEVGAAMRSFLDEVGGRVMTGVDVADLTVAEMPEAIVRSIRTALTPSKGCLDDSKVRLAALRERVPVAARAEFDALVVEACFVNEARDGRTVDTDYTALGLVRRALLEIGARLVARGRILRADHAFEATPDEVRALVRGAEAPSAQELAAYALWREQKSVRDAPARLGPPAASPPPMEWLPADARPAQEAVMVAVSAIFDACTEQSEGKRLKGLSVSSGVIEGRARVVLTPKDFERVEHGDVLVSAMTTPTYNVLLPLLSGVVTDRGGILSHTAQVAREYGLPAVVGTRDATSRIPDGARVRVDADRGEVQVLG